MLKDSPVFATVAASDMARARNFYEQTLALPVREAMADGVLYECGMGTLLLLYQSSYAGGNRATAASWEVEDVEKVVAELRGRGVRFEEYDLPGLKTVDGIANAGPVRARGELSQSGSGVSGAGLRR